MPVTTSGMPDTLTPALAAAVLSGYAAVLLAAATRLVMRRDVA